MNFWQAGFWNDGFWAAGFWDEEAPQSVFGGPAIRLYSPGRTSSFVSVGHRLSLTSSRR